MSPVNGEPVGQRVWGTLAHALIHSHMTPLLYPWGIRLAPLVGKDAGAGASTGTSSRPSGTQGPGVPQSNTSKPGGPPSSPHRWLALHFPSFRSLFSLRWRLAFVYIALFSIFIAILSLFLYRSISNSLLTDGHLAFPQRVSSLQAQILLDLCHNVTLQDADKFIMQQAPGDDIDTLYLLNASGQVISSSDGALRNQPFPYINSTFFSTWHPSALQPFSGTKNNDEAFDGLLVALQPPASCSSHSPAQVYLAATTSYSIEHATLRNLLLLIGLAGFVMIVTGALLIFFLTGIMLHPLRQMIKATQAMADGDLQQRVNLPDSGDEIGTLAMSFNQMADRIESLFQVQQDAERRAQRFVSDASHELRTPITSLRGFTEVLMRGAKDDPTTTQRVLKLMKNEAERMSRLVNDLLTLARLDEGHPLQMQDVDLVDIAIESVSKMKTQVPPGCKVSLDMATQERLKLRADAERLQQMLFILLDNALKYGCMHSGDSITLRLDKPNGNAHIQIIDNGQGISPEDLPHIFDRFYRGHYTLPSSGVPIGGTGLGLSIAIGVARAHHGNIVVSSKPQKETVFTVTLPCKD